MSFFKRLFKFSSFHVAAGIMLSRVFGLVRERFLTHFLGSGLEADALRAAIKIPNLLQNLLGEMAFSGAFIPVYSALDQHGYKGDARRLSIIVFRLMLSFSLFGVSVGMLLAPQLVDLISPGFKGAQRDLTIHLVRVLFPGSGFLVLSAWCLAILNSHRQYFLSYAAPVAWNLTIIGSLLAAEFYIHHENLNELASIVAFGFSLGGIAQLVIQIPHTLKAMGVAKKFNKENIEKALAQVKEGFFNTLVARGAVQIGGFVDLAFASMFPAGAVTCLSLAQTVALLPLSVFGSSFAVPQLTEFSRSKAKASDSMSPAMARNIYRVFFLSTPTCIGYIFFGEDLMRILFQGGRFSAEDTRAAWIVLSLISIGLLASLVGKVLVSALLALGDTLAARNIAVIKVSLSAILSLVFLYHPPYPIAGSAAVGYVALASSIGTLLEFTFIYTRLRKKHKVHIRMFKVFLIFMSISLFSLIPPLYIKYSLMAPGILSSIVVLAVYGLGSGGLGALYLKRKQML